MHQENERHRRGFGDGGVLESQTSDPPKAPEKSQPLAGANIFKLPSLKKETKTSSTTGVQKPTASARPALPRPAKPVTNLFEMNNNLEREKTGSRAN